MHITCYCSKGSERYFAFHVYFKVYCKLYCTLYSGKNNCSITDVPPKAHGTSCSIQPAPAAADCSN